MKFESVAVIGLGLMGGSLARDLARRGVRVLGYDRSDQVVQQAVDSGAVHERILDLTQVGQVDLIVLATPVDSAIELLDQVGRGLGQSTLITDLGSTKAAICRAAIDKGLGDRFVGSHPLAGDHRSGWESARHGLYHDATVFLTSPSAAANDAPAGAVADFWTSLEARPVRIDPDEHDRRMAWVSHLPQVLATALASVLADTGFTPADLGPGGRDMTRLAGSSPAMWAAIATSNADNMHVVVEQLQRNLSSFITALENREPEALHSFFRNGRSWLE